ncbi:hypothetical protein BpHYR1_008248 [Brachionus plicatilis]|uniref:Uncharacterized protein n=1 Tax=Brachionus plicatilis TaxID=10195 RepID=A0A3M7SBT4_BRAPC|nr:hypothetical protein BpHYR1_008248 [Brachionus plicatilis]
MKFRFGDKILNKSMIKLKNLIFLGAQLLFIFEILSLKEQQLFKRFAFFGTLGGKFFFIFWFFCLAQIRPVLAANEDKKKH